VNRRLLLAVLGWLATAGVATGLGIVLIGLFDRALVGPAGRTLSAEEVRQALATPAPTVSSPTRQPAAPPVDAPTPTPESTPAPARSPAPRAVSRVITTPGGSVVASCTDGLVTLRSWTPAQGYQVDDVEREPGRRVKVEFERGEAEVKVEIACGVDGRPTHKIRTD
jgi:hypothetical protein